MKYLFAFVLLLFVGNVQAQFEDELEDLRQLSYNIYDAESGKKVVDMATKLIAQKPDVAELYELRAWGYDVFDQDKAMADFRKAIELDPKNSNAPNGLGNILREKEQYEEALKYYQLALDNGAHIGVLLNIANVQEDMKDWDALEVTAMKLIENEKDVMLKEEGYVKMAAMYMEKGELEKAFEYYSQACLVGSPQGYYIYQMGKILIELGNMEEACQFLNEVKGTESFEYGCCKDIDAVLEEHCK